MDLTRNRDIVSGDMWKEGRGGYKKAKNCHDRTLLENG